MCSARPTSLLMAAFLASAASLPAADRPVLRLSLRHAVEIATSPEGSARIQLSTELTRQAEAKSTQARAALLPSIDGSLGEQNLNRNLAAFGFKFNLPIAGFQFPSVVGPFNLFDARVTASQSVFDFSSIRRDQASRVAAQAAKSDRANA